MTCIVGLEHNGRVYIGGDSAGVSDYDLTVRADEKVFRSGPFVMGFCGSFRMGQLLRYRLEAPKLPKDPDDLDRWMVCEFVDAVRECLAAGDHLKKKAGHESEGEFLVGVRGRLFTVQADFQVARSSHTYDAVGCGANLALGSLFTSEGVSPRKRVQVALYAAEQFSAGVRGPFTIEELR